MKKFLLFLITAIVGFAAHADKTIYYDNSATQWSSVNAHYWDDAADKTMTKVSGTSNIWKVTVPDKATNVIFQSAANNWTNDNCTADLAGFTSGNLYKGTKANNARCTITNRGAYVPANVYFSYDAGAGWQNNKAATKTTENGATVWSVDVTATSSNIFMVITNKTTKGNSDWNNLTGQDNTVYYPISVPDANNNVTVAANTAVNAELKANGPYHCVNFTNCTSNQGYTLKLILKNDAFQIKAEPKSVVNPNPPTPTEKAYTVYFYDQKELGSVKAHIWGTEPLHEFKSAEEEMTSTGKYVYVGGNYFPVYKYTFDWNKTPSGVLFYTGNGTKVTDDARFLNNGFYTNGVNYGVSGLTLVDKKEDVVTIYMHWKEELVTYMPNSLKNGGAPYCHVFVKDAKDNDFNYKKNGKAYQDYKSDAEKMYLVDEKYQIWGFDVDKSKINNYSDIQFTFNKDDGSEKDYYKASNAGTKWDSANWTKYIYTVHDGNYAVQSYMTYDEFTAEAAKGYPYLYVTGGTDGTNWDGMTIMADGETSMTALGWKPAEAKRIAPDTKGNPLFFIKVHPYLDNKKQTAFKISWIDTESYQKKNGNNKVDEDRDWATYDLGIIGVDDIKCTENKSNWGEILSVDANARKCFFQYNKANPLLEYNQFDWVITQGNMNNSGVSDYYCVVDMHPDCRTVTLCTFNPQPSVKVTPGTVNAATITPEQAKALHSDLECMRGADINGHVMIERINYLSGHMEIAGAPGVTNDVVDKAKFDRTYTFSLNGNELFEKDHPGTYNVDFMPMGSANEMSIATMYTSQITHLTFHSREGMVDMNPGDNFTDPSVEADGAEYNYKETGTNPETGKKDGIMRAYTKLLVTHDAKNLNVYTDYEISDANNKVYESPLADEEDPYTDGVNKPFMAWTPCFAEADWNASTHDWSTKSVETFNDGTKYIPMFINNALTLDEVPDFKPGTTTLPSKEFNVTVDAIYPILYSTRPTVTEVTTPQPTSKAAAPRIAMPDDLTDYALNFYRTSASTTVTTPGNVTGIDAIDAEAEADAPAEYFTIAGVRVIGEPAPGIYVVRRGSKVTKEVIR